MRVLGIAETNALKASILRKETRSRSITAQAALDFVYRFARLDIAYLPLYKEDTLQ